MFVTCVESEPALICEKHSAPVVDLPILVFYSNCHLGSTVTVWQLSVSNFLVIDIHTSGLPRTFCSFDTNYPVIPCTKEQIPALLMG